MFFWDADFLAAVLTAKSNHQAASLVLRPVISCSFANNRATFDSLISFYTGDCTTHPVYYTERFIVEELTAITMMSIGVGDPASVKPGGSGMFFVDDIELHCSDG